MKVCSNTMIRNSETLGLFLIRIPLLHPQLEVLRSVASYYTLNRLTASSPVCVQHVKRKEVHYHLILPAHLPLAPPSFCSSLSHLLLLAFDSFASTNRQSSPCYWNACEAVSSTLGWTIAWFLRRPNRTSLPCIAKCDPTFRSRPRPPIQTRSIASLLRSHRLCAGEKWFADSTLRTHPKSNPSSATRSATRNATKALWKAAGSFAASTDCRKKRGILSWQTIPQRGNTFEERRYWAMGANPNSMRSPNEGRDLHLFWEWHCWVFQRHKASRLRPPSLRSSFRLCSVCWWSTADSSLR